MVKLYLWEEQSTAELDIRKRREVLPDPSFCWETRGSSLAEFRNFSHTETQGDTGVMDQGSVFRIPVREKVTGPWK